MTSESTRNGNTRALVTGGAQGIGFAIARQLVNEGCRAITLVGLSALALPRLAASGASTDAALALGAFAVLNQLVRGETILHGVVGRPAPVVVHAPPPVVYAPPARVVYAPPRVVYAPPHVVAHRPPVVAHPHGRWMLSRGHWVWVARPGLFHPRHRR